MYNRKVFCTPGPWTKPFERIFFYRSINNNICTMYIYCIYIITQQNLHVLKVNKT